MDALSPGGWSDDDEGAELTERQLERAGEEFGLPGRLFAYLAEIRRRVLLDDALASLPPRPQPDFEKYLDQQDQDGADAELRRRA